MPRIRTFLDLSTAHLPEEVGTNLPGTDGVIAYETRYGCLMWVPPDPAACAAAVWDPPPPEVLAVQIYARGLGCDYVMFDSDAEIDPSLPSWS